MSRRLDWPGFLNARDLGGLPLRSGGETRPAGLIRSALPGGPARPSPRTLADYGVRTVIDLRSPRELAARPSPLHGLPGYRHLPLLGDREMDTVIEMPGLAGSYRWKVDNRGEAIAAILAFMADAPRGGILFHCLAGRDRTGVVAALLLSVAGVDRASIIEDYVLSDGTVQDGFRPLPWVMADLLDHLDRCHGGVPAYMAEVGVEATTLAALRRRLLG